MRSIVAVAFLVAVMAPVAARGDYCAQYAGVTDCGYPTLEACRQTISGVGGECIPGFGPAGSNSGGPAPNLFQRWREQQQPLQYPDPAQLPGGTAIPPPPDE
jgi:hypothetical protein